MHNIIASHLNSNDWHGVAAHQIYGMRCAPTCAAAARNLPSTQFASMAHGPFPRVVSFHSLFRCLAGLIVLLLLIHFLLYRRYDAPISSEALVCLPRRQRNAHAKLRLVSESPPRSVPLPPAPGSGLFGHVMAAVLLCRV